MKCPPMKVVVIGSGLIGLTSAWFLRRRGHEVTVLEREAGPGRQTSFANGALLSPSMPEPWNAPGCWRALLHSLGRPEAALKLRLAALPALGGWGIRFLRNSSVERYLRNTRSNLRLALYSREVLQLLRQQTGLVYGQAARGSLRIFRERASLARASAAVARWSGGEVEFRSLSTAQALELEPALAPIGGELAGALYCPIDETGDAHRFCVALAEQARAAGVEFRFGVQVRALEIAAGRVTAVRTADEWLIADGYVLAAASYSAPLLKPLGIGLPVRPAKGYSVTFAADEGKPPPLHLPIADDDLHAVVVPLDGAVRAAGTAEFAGYDLALRPERVRNLLNLVAKVLPEAGLDPAAARPWCGLRPMSADGVPVIGATGLPNLWVNTGHGPLGWTMAAGSGQLLADLLSAQTAAIDPAPYALARFASWRTH
jgi:D-amino-acid dehydrogenase